MKGPAGDAIFIVFFILIVALVTVKFWYPPLVAWIASIRRDVDKVTKDDVQLKEARKINKISTDIASYYEKQDEEYPRMDSMTPAERAKLYKERARQAGLGKR